MAIPARMSLGKWNPVAIRAVPIAAIPTAATGIVAGKAEATGTTKAATAAASPLGKDRVSRPLGRSRSTRSFVGATTRPAMSAAMQRCDGNLLSSVNSQDQSQNDENVSLTEELHGLRRMPEEPGHLILTGDTEEAAHRLVERPYQQCQKAYRRCKAAQISGAPQRGDATSRTGLCQVGNIIVHMN